MQFALLPLRDRVAKLLELGVPFELIERELIDQADLDDEQRAALWLYAWTLANRSDPYRREASTSSLAARRASVLRVLSRVASVAAAIIHLPGI